MLILPCAASPGCRRLDRRGVQRPDLEIHGRSAIRPERAKARGCVHSQRASLPKDQRSVNHSSTPRPAALSFRTASRLTRPAGRRAPAHLGPPFGARPSLQLANGAAGPCARRPAGDSVAGRAVEPAAACGVEPPCAFFSPPYPPPKHAAVERHDRLPDGRLFGAPFASSTAHLLPRPALLGCGKLFSRQPTVDSLRRAGLILPDHSLAVPRQRPHNEPLGMPGALRARAPHGPPP